MNDNLIYLDHASATPVDEVVLRSMLPYFTEHFFNPSAIYSCGVRVRHDFNNAKQRIAECLGAKSDELVMTAGATEANNIAFQAVNGKSLVSAIEHSSVLASAEQAGEVVKIVPTKRGRITAEAVKQALTPDISFVSIGLVNSELGTIQPIAEIAQVIEAERQRRINQGEPLPLLFHSDASQATNLIDIKVNRLKVDLLTLSAAKIYGPKQVGLLWVRPGVTLRPTIVGGGQESGLRGGTENVAGVVGFATALELATKRRASEIKRLQSLKDYMQKRLESEFPDMLTSSDSKKSLASFLNISFPGIDAERLVFWLESRGVMVATGSACSANEGRKSHVLKAIGLSDQEIDGSLRISLGRLSNEENCQRAIDLIIEAVKTEKARLNQC